MKKKLFLFCVTSCLVLGVLLVHGKAKLNTTTAVSAQTQNTDWPQLQHDGDKSGFSTTSSINGPFSIAWRWHPLLTDPNLDKVSISGRVQIVVGNGLACAGYYNGVMYCLNKDTGQLVWQYQAGGPISHAAAIADNKVIFGSADHYLYAVNTSNGTLAWKFKTGKSIQNAPCINNNTAYIGSGDGKMYAVNVSTGQKAWEYDSGSPILTSAACTNSTIYFGNESVQAFAVNAATGSLRWKSQLYGQSIAASWPVVSEANQVVFFRTQPLSTWFLLYDGDNVLSAVPNEKNATNIALEQEIIKNHLDSESGKAKTFWALNTTTGQEKYTAPIMYTSGEGAIPVPPIINPSTNTAYVVWRTKYSTFFVSGIRPYVDISKMDPATGTITHFTGPVVSIIHLISDESTSLSGSSNAITAYGAGAVAGINLNTESSIMLFTSHSAQDADYWNGSEGVFAYDNEWPKGSVLGGGGNNGAYNIPVSIAGNKVYGIAKYGLMVAANVQ